MPILFCDLETTGLLAKKHDTIEIALIATNDSLGVLGRFHRVVNVWYVHDLLAGLVQPEDFNIVPYVFDMHMKNGLWQASLESTLRTSEIDTQAQRWMIEIFGQANLGEKVGPQLAGNTISFDRSFLQADFPLLHACLHYRNIDLSTCNEMAKRFRPSLHGCRPGESTDSIHRAEADCEHSLELARYYAKDMLK